MFNNDGPNMEPCRNVFPNAKIIIYSNFLLSIC